MLDALKTLFENNVISEEIQSDIESAWGQKIQENREVVSQQLREEFAQKYEHDKKIVIESVEKLVTTRLTAEIEELAEDRIQLSQAKAKYMVAIRENSEKLNHFVAEKLASEIHEWHDDQRLVASNVSKMEEFVIETLAKEIKEFYTDKQDLAETKVRLVKEAKNQFNHIKSRFIKQSSGLVETVVKNTLTKEINQLKEDIDQARENDFGRKIFEAVKSEYQHSLLNEKSETSKLLNVIKSKDSQLAEAKVQLTRRQHLVESVQKDLVRSQEQATRKEVLSELLSPLAKQQREIMSELLESVQTGKLKSSFDKYLPAVVNNQPVAINTNKKQLVESKEFFGNRPEHNDIKSEVTDIRRLAGLSK